MLPARGRSVKEPRGFRGSASPVRSRKNPTGRARIESGSPSGFRPCDQEGAQVRFLRDEVLHLPVKSLVADVELGAEGLERSARGPAIHRQVAPGIGPFAPELGALESGSFAKEPSPRPVGAVGRLELPRFALAGDEFPQNQVRHARSPLDLRSRALLRPAPPACTASARA